MTILLYAEINRRCHFSNKLIKQYDIISLYTEKHNEYFEELIFKILKSMPSDIIIKILEHIGYNKKIGTFGLKEYTIWKPLKRKDTFKLKLLEHKQKENKNNFKKIK